MRFQSLHLILLRLQFNSIITSIIFTTDATTTTSPHNTIEDATYWMKLGSSAVDEALSVKKTEGVAKNGIIFIGDGMGLPTITAGRIFKGQAKGHSGEEGYLFFEKFQNVGLLKTYNVDRQVPDSAGTATALFSGVKGKYYTVGLDGTATFNVCRTDVQEKASVSSIIDWAIAAGKSTGIVTTTRVTHATPAAAYGHSAHRDWECDSKIPLAEQNLGCKDIARQLIEDEPGRHINVVLGGGEQVFRSKVNETSKACVRADRADLVWDWMQYQRGQGRKYRYVRNKQQLFEGNLIETTDYLLGLFAPSHIPYDKDRNTGDSGQPSLSEMTTQAIKILKKNPKGFILIVEGGRIDHAHHDNLAHIALEELVAFDLAIEESKKMMGDDETIFVVTADHSHAMSINGYPKRGNPITGLGDKTPQGFHYQTLSYTNGPGYNFHRQQPTSFLEGTNSSLDSRNTWRDLTTAIDNSTDFKPTRNQPHQAGFWMDYETHGGEDVPVYATGPMAHLFHGVHEQTHVPFSVAYSMCIGPYEKNCREPPKKVPVHSVTKKPGSSSSSSSSSSSFFPHLLLKESSAKLFLLILTTFLLL